MTTAALGAAMVTNIKVGVLLECLLDIEREGDDKQDVQLSTLSKAQQFKDRC